MTAKGGEKLIFHIDVNSAFLSWTAVKRLQEEPGSVDLRMVPAVVGGDPTTRHGIVTAKSLPAKRYGIRTAEPIVSAMKKCPGLIVVPSDFQTYRAFSHRFMDILKSYTPLVEQASIDEAYVDVTELCPGRHSRSAGWAEGMCSRSAEVTGADDPSPGSRVQGGRSVSLTPRQAAVELAGQIRKRIRSDLGFTVNVGISSNRLLAKMASDFEKPDRTHTLFPEEVGEKLWPLPIGDLYGCGQRTAERLRTLGIRTIGDAAKAPQEILIDHLGEKAGLYVHRASNGIGRASVSPVREDAKSYSNEWTTSSDITAETYEAEFLPLLHNLCAKVAGRLQRDGVYGKTVVVTVKTDDFRRRSAQRQLTDASSRMEILFPAASALAEKLLFGPRGLFEEGAGIRLVGAGVTDLEDGSFRQMSLLDPEWLEEMASPEDDEREPSADRAARLRRMEDQISRKYGKGAVQKGMAAEKWK